jgi:hypothetical protein
VRIRALLYAAIRRSGLRAVAADLDVTAESLQVSTDLQNPHPSVEVLLAVIRYHGVDPTWLLTGEYDLATHREALENPSSAASLLARTSLRRDRSQPLRLDDLETDAESDKRPAPRTYRVAPADLPDPEEHRTAL